MGKREHEPWGGSVFYNAARQDKYISRADADSLGRIPPLKDHVRKSD